jgi:hypothetical protein
MKNSVATEGEDGSEQLPALRRYRICCQARGHQGKVRGRCIYPLEVPDLRRQRTEKFDASYDRGLTARPVVLAKTYAPGASCSRRDVAIRAGRSFPELFCSQLYAIPAAFERDLRLEVEAVSIRLRPPALAR